jgi:hypothetical protein
MREVNQQRSLSTQHTSENRAHVPKIWSSERRVMESTEPPEPFFADQQWVLQLLRHPEALAKLGLAK